MWALHYTPKIFGFIAFLVNPIFIYLIFTGKSSSFGNYRFLLLYFATFNVIYSITDILVPVGIYSYHYCFSIFISDGLFVSLSPYHLGILSARCSLISCSYAVLISHFLYRYLVIRKSELTGERFPIFMLGSVVLCGMYFGFWYTMCAITGAKSYEKEGYFYQDFLSVHGMDSYQTNALLLLFKGSDKSTVPSWTVTILLTIVSFLSILLFIILGWSIMKKLNSITFEMSRKTTQLQRSLLKALIIQTVIPICVSFTPCMLSWYAPAFDINLGREIYVLNVIALAAFPFFDPMAVVLCLPLLRSRLMSCGARTDKNDKKVRVISDNM